MKQIESAISLIVAGSSWSVKEEDGYVKVYRGNELICAGIITGEKIDGEKRVYDLEFTENKFRNSNSTRLKVIRILKEHGYR